MENNMKKLFPTLLTVAAVGGGIYYLTRPTAKEKAKADARARGWSFSEGCTVATIVDSLKAQQDAKAYSDEHGWLESPPQTREEVARRLSEYFETFEECDSLPLFMSEDGNEISTDDYINVIWTMSTGGFDAVPEGVDIPRLIF
jgi:hypothetical protein